MHVHIVISKCIQCVHSNKGYDWTAGKSWEEFRQNLNSEPPKMITSDFLVNHQHEQSFCMPSHVHARRESFHEPSKANFPVLGSAMCFRLKLAGIQTSHKRPTSIADQKLRRPDYELSHGLPPYVGTISWYFH